MNYMYAIIFSAGLLGSSYVQTMTIDDICRATGLLRRDVHARLSLKDECAIGEVQRLEKDGVVIYMANIGDGDVIEAHASKFLHGERRLGFASLSAYRTIYGPDERVCTVPIMDSIAVFRLLNDTFAQHYRNRFQT